MQIYMERSITPSTQKNSNKQGIVHLCKEGTSEAEGDLKSIRKTHLLHRKRFPLPRGGVTIQRVNISVHAQTVILHIQKTGGVLTNTSCHINQKKI